MDDIQDLKFVNKAAEIRNRVNNLLGRMNAALILAFPCTSSCIPRSASRFVSI